ncbi:hypothetical protein EBZ39_19655, partial [bacterium]|nr:hypothetical protein [bacterium]
MATTVSFNGTAFVVPSIGEEDWGGPTRVDGLLVSLANNSLARGTGSFPLTTELDLGASKGIKVLSVKSQGTNISTTGFLRLANSESVAWRNNANSADLPLTVNNTDQLVFNGVPLVSSTGALIVQPGSSISGTSADHVIVNNASGNLSSEAQLSKSRGGCGADVSAVTFPSVGTLVTTSATQSLTNKEVVRRVVTLVDAPTISLDASLGDVFRVTLAGNRTLSISNAKDGQMISLEI